MHTKRKNEHVTLPLAALLRDPTSEDEWRRTIAAWSQFIQRHLTSPHAELREMALVTLLKRGAAYTHVQEYTAAQADSEQVLALHPDPYTAYKAYELRATLFTARGNDLEALEAWMQAIARCQTLPRDTVSSEERAQLVLERGKCYARLKRYEEAIADFSLTIQIVDLC